MATTTKKPAAKPKAKATARLNGALVGAAKAVPAPKSKKYTISVSLSYKPEVLTEEDIKDMLDLYGEDLSTPDNIIAAIKAKAEKEYGTRFKNGKNVKTTEADAMDRLWSDYDMFYAQTVEVFEITVEEK
jgi:hypothetical protein